ncbi:MAG: thiamine-phosphate pyrophosphorylase [Candidatus Omnitrophica bacterium]|nr:thiamine-phosphate pyrophosphorylase [Candidatus Omnitrophota bacterium]
MNKKVFRILDANANRLREALRVCEDISRFIISDKSSTRRFKALRHKTILAVKSIDFDGKTLAGFRDSAGDIGKRTIKSESSRKGIGDIFKANIKRAEESVRVLEEFSKLSGGRLPGRFKNMRFELYSLESDIVEKL